MPARSGDALERVWGVTDLRRVGLLLGWLEEEVIAAEGARPGGSAKDGLVGLRDEGALDAEPPVTAPPVYS